MHPRIVALLIAFALFWTGFTAAQEPTASAATAAPGPSVLTLAAYSTPGLPDGLLDQGLGGDHHTQSQAESPTDLPEPIAGLPDLRSPLMLATPPRPYTPAAMVAPYLDGPQRPPCPARLLA